MAKKFSWFILLFFVGIVHAQLNNNRKLPTINVMALGNNAFEAGKVSVKFHRFHIAQSKATVTSDHQIVFNNTDLNHLSQSYHFNSFKSLFSNVLKDNELLEKHQKYGLDLWFTIEFDETSSVQLLYTLLKKTNLFEVVEPVYKKHLLDEGKECNKNVIDGSEVIPPNTNRLLNYTGIQSRHDAIEYVPNDPLLNQQWSYKNTGQGNGTIGKDIQLFDAWDIETGKPNVLVAVHDMGIQLNHPDLAQNIAIGKSFNFISNDTNIVMGYHGTHTAGTIAAVNNNGIGVSGIAGGDGSMNSGVRLMSMQIFQGNKNAGLAEGFVYAADKGAAISSNSWAYDIEDIYEISVMDAIDYFIECGGGSALQGGLVIFAAGNLSRDIRYYPSVYDRVICVAATNNRDTKANYSTFGSWVDIAAPGGDYNASSASQIWSTTSYSGYAGDHGTSMACPHVSGVAALIASKLSGKASASDVRDILLSTTDNIDSLNPVFVGLLGTGRLNAYKALTKAQSIYNSLNIAAVDSFKVTSNCNDIVLNWTKNAGNNDVIIAYSNTNNLGSLVNGKTYQVGDVLIGGGKIIYKGSANNFVLQNTDSFLHYFKVWSVDAANNYSYGKTADIVAPVYINQSGSITQNFDFPPYFPTQEWRAINPDSDFAWTHTAADTAHTGAGDLYSMCMYNYNYNTLLGAVDILTSPLVNVQHSDSIKISFWYAYQYKNTGLPISDSLDLLVSNDCGKTYTSLWKKGGSALATVTNTGDTAFYPFGLDKWKQVLVDLSSLNSNNKLMFAFRSVNGKGNNLFLDNIKIDVRYKNDVAVLQVLSPVNASCDNTITPQIKIANKGNNTITSLKIKYVVDGGNIVSSNWNGSLKKDDSTFVNLAAIPVNTGHHQIVVYSLLPNNSADEFVLNDSIHNSFFISPPAILPLSEGFEGNAFPPANWYVSQQPKDVITWIKNNTVGSNSNASAVMKNYMYDDSSLVDDIVTPVFIVDRNMDSATVSFDYAHTTRYITNPANIKYDSLEVDISRDCGSTWSTLWKKGGDGLQTIHQTQNFAIEYIPKSGDWATTSILIPGSFNKGDNVQLRFRNIENFGNNVYLDNIKIDAKYYAPGIKENGYAIYPNPVGNLLTIQHLNTPSNLKAITVTNSIGKRVITNNYSGNATKDILLNTASLANGLYVLQLIYTDKTITGKIVKMK